jgi:hypothetical protein
MVSTRNINEWCEAAAYGRGKYVFCSTESSEKLRIIGAKTFKGVQKVKALSSGKWVVPTKVWVE